MAVAVIDDVRGSTAGCRCVTPSSVDASVMQHLRNDYPPYSRGAVPQQLPLSLWQLDAASDSRSGRSTASGSDGWECNDQVFSSGM